MAFKLIIFTALFAVALASHLEAPVVSYEVPIVKEALIEEVSHPAHYDFAYGVNDPHTGDIKHREESRRGDLVRGSYSLLDADGTRRVVEYAADALNGFNAVVRKEPLAVETIAPVVEPVVKTITKIAAPVVTKIAAPLPAVAKIATPVVTKIAEPLPAIAKIATPLPAITKFATPFAPALGYAAAPAFTRIATPLAPRFGFVEPTFGLGYARGLHFGGDFGYAKTLLRGGWDF